MAVPTYAGVIIDLIVALILVLSFLGGLKEGAVKEFIGLLAFVIALAFTGAFFVYVLGWVGFMPDYLWRSFLTFLITMGIIVIVLHLAFLPLRFLLDKIWPGGFLWNALGGIFGLINTGLGLTLMVVVLSLYPVFTGLNDWLAASKILSWLVNTLGPIIMSLMHMTGAY